MPQYIPAGYASVLESLRLTDDPQDQAVTYGIKVNEANPPSSSDLLETLGSLFNTHIMPLVAQQYVHVNTHIEWQVLAPPSAPIVGDRPSAQTGGFLTGAIIPQNSAHLIRKNTALGGRRNRGRMYLPGVGESDVSNVGVLTTTRINNLNTAYANWLAAVKASIPVEEMVILHSLPAGTTTPLPTTVTSLVCQPVIATQRRRLR
jgi:hypothetical protein